MLDWGFFRVMHLRGTVFRRMWWKSAFLASYTAVIVCIHLYAPGWRMEFKQTLIPILGVVTGLLLVFRTNTAYDRYWEGRRTWGQMTNNIRTLTRCTWISVKEKEPTDLIEKKSVINILVAFAVATKHYLRHEYSYDYDDLRNLIKHLPGFSTPSSNQSLAEQQKQQKRRRSTTVWLRGAHDTATPTNIPIELSYYIASYIRDVAGRGLIETPIHTAMQTALTSMIECLTTFERILRTPIPIAYSVHLTYCTWIYLLALPYQLVNDLEWWTLAAVTLASVSLLGILEIGKEIENPFGYDANDLPLDDFCQVMKREVRMIIGNRIPTTTDWVFTYENTPFGESSTLNAQELSKLTLEELHKILSEDAHNALPSKSEGNANVVALEVEEK